MTERIIKWNDHRGFLKDFDMKREVSYTLSEDLEMLAWKRMAWAISCAYSAKSNQYSELLKIRDSGTHDDFARWLVNNFWRGENTKADFLDKCCDQQIFLTGAMAKVFNGVKDE